MIVEIVGRYRMGGRFYLIPWFWILIECIAGDGIGQGRFIEAGEIVGSFVFADLNSGKVDGDI